MVTTGFRVEPQRRGRGELSGTGNERIYYKERPRALKTRFSGNTRCHHVKTSIKVTFGLVNKGDWVDPQDSHLQ